MVTGQAFQRLSAVATLHAITHEVPDGPTSLLREE
jgi:hypothetical protein